MSTVRVPAAIAAANAAPRTKQTNYPEPFASRMAGREKRPLGDVFGLSNFWTYQPAILRCRGCPDWAQQVRQWQQGRSNRLESWPYPAWYIPLPRR